MPPTNAAQFITTSGDFSFKYLLICENSVTSHSSFPEISKISKFESSVCKSFLTQLPRNPSVPIVKIFIKIN